MGRAAFYSRFYFIWVLFTFGVASGCSILATRPVQEMSDTAAAIKAAREVQADTLTPELFRQANEWYQLARREYKFKNFKLASQYAARARDYAEQAEFEAVRGGVSRGDLEGAATSHPDSPSSPTPVSPEQGPTSPSP